MVRFSSPKLKERSPTNTSIVSYIVRKKRVRKRVIRPTGYEDRFIPRNHITSDAWENKNDDSKSEPDTPTRNFDALLQCEILDENPSKTRLMTFGQVNHSSEQLPQSNLLKQFQKTVEEAMFVAGGGSSIMAEKVLDAPEFTSDAVLNTLAGSSRGVFAAALTSRIYIWQPGNTKLLYEDPNPENIITSLSWNEEGRYLAVGANDKSVVIWDVNAQKPGLRFNGSSSRVTCLEWNLTIITLGTQNGEVLNYSIRGKTLIALAHVHKHPITSMKWSSEDNGAHLAVACEGGYLSIWPGVYGEVGRKPKHFIQCAGPVYSVSWSPFSYGHLAVGCSDENGTLCFFQAFEGKLIQSKEFGEPITAVVWSNFARQILVALSGITNTLCVLRCGSLHKILTLSGHTQKILSVCPAGDGVSVLSGSPDETLRFWSAFQKRKGREPNFESIPSFCVR